MKELNIKKIEKKIRLSTFEKNKIMVSKMSDEELGLLIKKMKKKIHFLGENIYGKGLYMILKECLRRTTTDVNVREGQDTMRIYIFRKRLHNDPKMKLNKNTQTNGVIYFDKNSSSLVNSFSFNKYRYDYIRRRDLFSISVKSLNQ